MSWDEGGPGRVAWPPTPEVHVRLKPVLQSGIVIVEVDMNLKVILEPSDEGGYTVIVPALPGCISEGDSKEEALRNIREAIDLYLEPVEDDRNFAPNAVLTELAV